MLNKQLLYYNVWVIDRQGITEIRSIVFFIWCTLAERRLQIHDLRPLQDRLARKFEGYCGLAQSIAGYALLDVGLDPQAIATQSLTEYWHGHAALTLNSKEKDTCLLIDPTFVQFTNSNMDHAERSPAHHLNETAQGREIVEELLKNGYIQLTAHQAGLYVSAFCRGKSPFADDDLALMFLQNPPQHPYHFNNRNDEDAFSRVSLSTKKLLIDPSLLRPYQAYRTGKHEFGPQC